ncbi:MAG: hypothetical protein JWQ04_3185 [Pedosphaera sp.]|nr:hypothetical protein [Pedosphaera sp.]
MALSRIAQFATSPLLSNFAVTSSQNAIRPVGQFIAPICEVPDINFRYKKYTEKNRYKVPITRRQPGGGVTQIGFSADDVVAVLQPNALDFPIHNADNLSDEGLQFAMMEGTGCLADASAMALENEIITGAQAASLASPLTQEADFSDPFVDPVALIDALILKVVKAAKNGAPIKVLFGPSKFKQFRNNPLIKSRFVVSDLPAAPAGTLGLLSPQIEDVSEMLMTKPQVRMSQMVIDMSAEGMPENIQFFLDNMVLVFASSDTPNRMDQSFAKTFTVRGGLFKSGAYSSEDERDQVLKMDWTTLPAITNPGAMGALI